MTSKQSFRSWCRNLPEPHAYVFDGEKILLGKGAHRFATVEAAIRAKDPDQCDAVDKDGAIIRTYVFRSETREEDEEEEVTAAASAPGDAKMLAHFATLLSKAYAQGAKDHADAYTESHKQVVNLCNGVLNRCQSLERLLNQMLRDVRADAVAAREDLEEVLDARREEQEAPPGAKGPASLIEALVARRMAAMGIPMPGTTPPAPAPEANGGSKQ